MARIPDSFIQDLLNRVDIVDVVGRYLPVKKAGQNYIACCPFHKEKSPSFTVSPAKQFYHCFGCGENGSAISFIMGYQGVTFPDAVRILAQEIGLPLPADENLEGESDKSTSGIFDVLKITMDYYRALLKNSPDAINYLKKRGLSGSLVARFGLGYAPGKDNWQALKEIFPDYDWNPLLLEAGLVVEKENTQHRYDRFRDRIVFPILSQRAQVIGFGGRVMGEGEPKYLNSPETPVFQKGRELYGLPQAQAAIRDRGHALVVEGYMDVLVLHQHGIEYAVASLGTACTSAHIKKLLKLADKVTFCFDGDLAGQRAAWRALENSLPLVTDDKRLCFLFLPSEQDPDSYVRQWGQAQFELLLTQSALPLSQYLLKVLSGKIDLTMEEGRARLLHIVQPYLAQLIQAPALRILLEKRLGELCQLSPEEVILFRSRNQQTQIESGIHRQKSEKKGNATLRHRSHQDALTRLLHLVLYAPWLAVGGEPFWVDWPREGRVGLVADALDWAYKKQSKNSVAFLEMWRDKADYGLLAKTLHESIALFGKFTEEEISEEFRTTCEAVRQALNRLSDSDRCRQLEFRAANGGLTEAEKQEYLELIVRG